MCRFLRVPDLSEEQFSLASILPDLEVLEVTIPYIENEITLKWLGLFLGNAPKALRKLTLDFQLIYVPPMDYEQLRPRWSLLLSTAGLDEVLTPLLRGRLEEVSLKISVNDFYGRDGGELLSRQMAFEEAEWRASKAVDMLPKLKASGVLTYVLISLSESARLFESVVAGSMPTSYAHDTVHR